MYGQYVWSQKSSTAIHGRAVAWIAVDDYAYIFIQSVVNYTFAYKLWAVVESPLSGKAPRGQNFVFECLSNSTLTRTSSQNVALNWSLICFILKVLPIQK